MKFRNQDSKKITSKQLRAYGDSQLRITILKDMGGEVLEGSLDEMSTLKDGNLTLNGWFFVRETKGKSFNFRANHVAKVEVL